MIDFDLTCLSAWNASNLWRSKRSLSGLAREKVSGISELIFDFHGRNQLPNSSQSTPSEFFLLLAIGYIN